MKQAFPAAFTTLALLGVSPAVMATDVFLSGELQHTKLLDESVNYAGIGIGLDDQWLHGQLYVLKSDQVDQPPTLVTEKYLYNSSLIGAAAGLHFSLLADWRVQFDVAAGFGQGETVERTANDVISICSCVTGFFATSIGVSTALNKAFRAAVRYGRFTYDTSRQPLLSLSLQVYL